MVLEQIIKNKEEQTDQE